MAIGIQLPPMAKRPLPRAWARSGSFRIVNAAMPAAPPSTHISITAGCAPSAVPAPARDNTPSTSGKTMRRVRLITWSRDCFRPSAISPARMAQTQIGVWPKICCAAVYMWASRRFGWDGVIFGGASARGDGPATKCRLASRSGIGSARADGRRAGCCGAGRFRLAPISECAVPPYALKFPCPCPCPVPLHHPAGALRRTDAAQRR